MKGMIGLSENIRGKAWKFGDNLDLDHDILPFKYVVEQSDGVSFEKTASHVMETINPEFSKQVKKGDFLVAGRNFGHGKAHMEGTEALKFLGISAVIVDSVAPDFLKNALHIALPVLIADGVTNKINQNDELEVNIQTGVIRNLATGEIIQTNPAFPPGHSLYAIMEAGGYIEFIKRELKELGF